MASIRTLKLRAWLKNFTGVYHESTAQHVAFVEQCCRPHAFDAWACANVDPEDLDPACAQEGAFMPEELNAFPGQIPSLSLVAASSLGYTPEQLRAWGLL